ncbi:TylF/MycF/NovP-related O-methyltransferase [Streptomyces olivaceus]|uniref:TylF/MycF/NovP-related O-methyltransferase n=1 Tax=Streptomyces olivaceus TaxID=47716 RepID=UPI0033ADB931
MTGGQGVAGSNPVVPTGDGRGEGWFRRHPKPALDRFWGPGGNQCSLTGVSGFGMRRPENVGHCVKTALADGVPGGFTETGVWRGGTCIMMRAVLRTYGVTDRCVWVAHSFEGMPKADASTRVGPGVRLRPLQRPHGGGSAHGPPELRALRVVRRAGAVPARLVPRHAAHRSDGPACRAAPGQ